MNGILLPTLIGGDDVKKEARMMAASTLAYRPTVIVTIVALITTGCTPSITVRGDEPLNNDRVFNYEQVNARLQGASATILCLNGAAYHADNFHLTIDSLSFVEQETGIMRQAMDLLTL